MAMVRGSTELTNAVKQENQSGDPKMTSGLSVSFSSSSSALPCPLRSNHGYRLPPLTRLPQPISWPGFSFSTTATTLGGQRRRGNAAAPPPPVQGLGKSAAGGPRRNDNDDEDCSQFLDENGVVEDMDGYLNYLSLEYDSVWDTKPSWCQPWTITLTGVLAIAGSWFILHSVLVTAIVGFLICSWWYIFLYSYPKAYTEMIADRRKRVTSGVEDTFGLSKKPMSWN